MNHPTEADLVLHYYAEEDDARAIDVHLEACLECRRAYASLQHLLNTMDALPVPDRGSRYEEEVWQRVGSRLHRRRWFGPLPAWRWALSTAAMAALLVAAFLAGRFYPRPSRTAPLVADAGVRERVLLVAVGDYLERSQMVLVELSNASANGPLDISAEQERAQDLIGENRLYRQTAVSTGNTSVATLLDELERVLLDVAHGPSRLGPKEVESLRRKLEAQGIIFKIRVVNSTLQSRPESSTPDERKRSL